MDRRLTAALLAVLVTPAVLAVPQAQSVRAATSTDCTRPITNCPVRSIWRMGATTCSGKMDAPRASGSMGLNVVWLSSLMSRSR